MRCRGKICSISFTKLFRPGVCAQARDTGGSPVMFLSLPVQGLAGTGQHKSLGPHTGSGSGAGAGRGSLPARSPRVRDAAPPAQPVAGQPSGPDPAPAASRRAEEAAPRRRRALRSLPGPRRARRGRPFPSSPGAEAKARPRPRMARELLTHRPAPSLPLALLLPSRSPRSPSRCCGCPSPTRPAPAAPHHPPSPDNGAGFGAARRDRSGSDRSGLEAAKQR